jgi:WD40 repeat protein
LLSLSHPFSELIEKLESNESSSFYLFKILRAHILPLTNCAFNKSGDKFITGSYDRTCKVWNTLTGDEILTLEGHRNVVYAIAFNNPYGDKIITGSFGMFLPSYLYSYMPFDLSSLPQTRHANYGVQRQVNCITPSEDMQLRLFVYPSTLMAP